MRVNGLADIDRIAAHLHRQTDLADQIPGVSADDAATDHSMGRFIE